MFGFRNQRAEFHEFIKPVILGTWEISALGIPRVPIAGSPFIRRQQPALRGNIKTAIYKMLGQMGDKSLHTDFGAY